MHQDTSFSSRLHVHPAKTQISLHIQRRRAPKEGICAQLANLCRVCRLISPLPFALDPWLPTVCPAKTGHVQADLSFRWAHM